MNTYPVYPLRNTTDLSGLWNFEYVHANMTELDRILAEGKLTFPEKLLVPSCFDATVDHAGKRGLGFYRRIVRIGKDGRIRLNFGGLLLVGKIFWDGREIGFDPYPYSAYSCEVDATKGDHELMVVVDNNFYTEFNNLFFPGYDFFGFGGILRSVTMSFIEPVRFGRCPVVTLDVQAGKVRLEPEVNVPDGTILAITVQFDEGRAITHNFTFRGGKSAMEFFVDNPTPWTPETPNLHTVKLTMPDLSDAIVERFGIRTIEAKGGKFLLNGKEIFLKGFNRHESHPEFGAATPVPLMLEDLQRLRQMNCNFIRGCHYPQAQEFLDLCDELGFLVWEESLGWGNEKTTLAHPVFFQQQVEQTVNMVRVSRNHPCVILWGFLNECHSHEAEARTLITEIVKAVKAEDASRPLTYASMMIGYGDCCLDLVDVIACNTYPGWYGTPQYCDDPLAQIPKRLDEVMKVISEDRLKDKPLIISEIGAAALYGYRDDMHVLWSEGYQADLYEKVCSMFPRYPRIQGIAFWQFTDTRSVNAGNSLNRARGFNNKGILNEYRMPKMAAEVVKRHFKDL